MSAYYGASVAEFLATAPEAVIGVLAMADLQGALEAEQRQAWEEEIDILRAALAGFEGMVFLEFDVPRLGSRIDAAIVSGPAVLAVEFKCGERHFTRDAYNQVWDYALDLKNFHQASHSAPILRLKPHAIDVRVSVDPIHWFLGDPSDTRSSYYLEDAATEFQVQGLEVDWACITWDADFRLVNGCWRYHSFRGDVWTNVLKTDRQRYLLNAYRVLLTRARQGMAIFVPPGDRRDPTRLPQFYDGTFEYLRGVGVSEI